MDLQTKHSKKSSGLVEIKMHILLAEDDINISTIAIMALEQVGGHTVTHVDNGKDALEQALTEKYDLIILDQMMPLMNGLTVCKEYRSLPTSCTPVIFLSAKCHEDEINAFKNMGLGYIQKPFDPATLSHMIDEILATQNEDCA